MKRRFLEWGLFGIFIGVFVGGLNARYPMIGVDYFYVFPRLLEGKWHFLRQGFAPLRFAPHLCGGFPQYGNPQDHFYSLPQLFTLIADPWTAVLLSAVIIMILGYVGWVRFGRDILRLSDAWSHVLALVMSANGFYFMHMLVGHLWVMSLPLLSWMLWLLFGPARESKRQLIARAILFAFITAYILYSGSQTLVFLLLLIIAACVPFDLLLAHRSFERAMVLLRRFAVFGFFSLVLGASKLVAVWSLMRTLNMQATFSGYHAGESMILFALKSFWWVPQSVALFASEQTQLSRVQEESMHTPHIALVGLIALAFFMIRDRKFPVHRKIGLVLYSILLIAFVLLLLRGSGVVPETLQHFPLFSALRVPERFLFILSLLASIAGVWGASLLLKNAAKRWTERMVTGGIMALTIGGFLLAYMPMLFRDDISVTMPYDQVLQSMREADGYLEDPVSTAFEPTGDRVSDFHYLFSGSTGTQCYEALPLELPQLKNGPVDMVYDDAFNIYNPACLQYPEANSCVPRDRVRADDRQNLFRFTYGEKTTWKLSALQMWADRVTLVGLLLFPVIAFVLKRKLRMWS